MGLLAELSIIFTEADIDVKSVNVRINKKNQATTVFGFEVNGKEELRKMPVLYWTFVGQSVI